MTWFKTWRRGGASPAKRGLVLRGKAAARILLAFAAAAAGTAAYAGIPTVIAPLQVEPDRNNVNLTTGMTRIEMPVLSVPAAPNLRFDRLQNAAPYFTAKIYTAPSDDHDNRSYAIHIGAESSDAIDCYDDDCTSNIGSGAIFDQGDRTYLQAGSAVLWDFSSQSVITPTPDRNLTYYASTATYPNGEVIGFEYDKASPGLPFGRILHRPRKLTSSLGYYIAITYANNDDPLATDWSRVTQAALYRVEAPGTSDTLLRRFTYSGTTIRDHGASTSIDGRDHVCTGCSNGLGHEIETSSGSMQLPGEGAPALQVTTLSGPHPVVGAVTRDGVGWSYSYDNLQQQPGTLRRLFDHLTVTGPNDYHQVYDVSHVYHSVHDQATNRLHVTITGVHTRVSEGAAPRSTAYHYGAYDRLVRIVYPELNEVGITYDFYGNVTARTSTPKPNSGLSAITEEASFPTTTCAQPGGNPILCYRPSWTKDGRGQRTDYVYNANGEIIERLDPADNAGVRRRTSIAYTTAGPPRRSSVRICADTGASCPTNSPVRTEYDYSDNTALPSAERRIDGATGPTLTTAFGYDPAGRLLWTDGPLTGSDDRSYNRYDIYGRRTWEIGGRGPNGVRIARRFTYRDSDDKPVSVETGTLPDETSSTLTVARRADTAYDPRRNPIRERATGFVDGVETVLSVTDQSFDNRGQLLCTTVRMNRTAFPSSTSTGSLPEDAACTPGSPGSGADNFGADRITHNVYDHAGQLLTVQRAYATGLQQDYARYQYTLNGRQSSVTDANGNRAEMTYDGHDRQRRWIFPASSLAARGTANAADYEEYDYDANGNRTSLRKRDTSTLSYSYDNLNRLLVKTVPERSGLDAGHTRDVYYGYNLRDQQLYARFDSHTGTDGVTNAYDAFGRLASASSTMAGMTRTLAYQYDAAGNRTRITHPDGQHFDYRYDALSRFTGLRENDDSDLVSQVYHPTGERYVIGRGGAAAGWLYDGIGRLRYFVNDLSGAAGVNWTFTRSPAGQIATSASSNDGYSWTGAYNINRNYSADGLNRYSQAGTAHFTYDANGNLITTPSTVEGQTITYTYDVENRLVAASGGVQLAYDPLGRLAWTTGSPNLARFLYDGDALVAEYDYGGEMVRRYVHGAGIDEPLLQYNHDGDNDNGVSSANRRQLFADVRGSIVTTTDAAGGNAAINTYDPWGIPGAANSGRFQYTGQTWLPELGLYYYKARLYSPFLGRFLQTDPVGYQDQINLYAYVGNDPINRTDPTGKTIFGLGNRDERRRVERLINARAQGTYRFRGKDHVLTRVSQGRASSDRSAYYSSRLDQAIASNTAIDVGISQEMNIPGYRPVNVDAEAGGGMTFDHPVTGRVTTLISGNPNNLTRDINNNPLPTDGADILAHELVGHAIPRIVGPDSGNAVTNENKVRAETGRGQRAPDDTECELCF